MIENVVRWIGRIPGIGWLLRALSRLPGCGWLRRLLGAPPGAEISPEPAIATPVPEDSQSRVRAPARQAATPRPDAAPAGLQLGLAAVEPDCAFAFWEVPAQAIASARVHLDAPVAPAVLRVFDVTAVDFDGSNARHTVDVPLEELAASADDGASGVVKGSRYLDLGGAPSDGPRPVRIYCELGLLGRDGTFVPIAWSPIVDLPAAEESTFDADGRSRVSGAHSSGWRARLPRRTAAPETRAVPGGSTEPAAAAPSKVVVRLGGQATDVASSGRRVAHLTRAYVEVESAPAATPAAAAAAGRPQELRSADVGAAPARQPDAAARSEPSTLKAKARPRGAEGRPRSAAGTADSVVGMSSGGLIPEERKAARPAAVRRRRTLLDLFAPDAAASSRNPSSKKR